MNTHKIREYLDMTQKEMSAQFGISYRTITSWDSRDNMPEWAYALFMNYVVPVYQEMHKEMRRFAGRIENDAEGNVGEHDHL